MRMYEFSIQCDHLQRRTEGTAKAHTWLSLMAHAKQISPDAFLANCDTETLLDEGETLADFMAGDDGAACYVSSYGDERVFFIQTSGFEFFFTKGGVLPPLLPVTEDQVAMDREYQRDALAAVMLPPNHPRRNGAGGFEYEVSCATAGVQHLRSPQHDRLIFSNDIGVYGGLLIKNGVIDQIYVRPHLRRQGLGTFMVNQAEEYFGRLAPSEAVTKDGQAFFSSSKFCASLDVR